MKVFVLLAAIIVATNASFSDHERWTSFKVKYNKNYDIIEEKLRFQIYQKNLRKIDAHNERYEKEEVSYFLTDTEFADWTDKERKDRLNFKGDVVQALTKRFEYDSNYVLPSSVDWREKGAVGPVKDQHPCDGCWAFATTGALEGQLRIHKNDTVSLSEQDLIDCDDGSFGCLAGDMSYALTYVASNGLSSEDQYPFTGHDGKCKKVKNKHIASIHGYSFIDPIEYNLADGLANVGPIIVGISAGGDFELYGGGVFDGNCGRELNHAVLGVGYTDDYWIIKNSWGAKWGEDGFIRLKRGKEQCKIGSYYLYPIL